MKRHLIITGLMLLGIFGTPATAADQAASGTLVVLNKSGASASLLDLSSGEEYARIQTGEGPHEAVVSPDGRYAIVANYGIAPPGGSSLTVIDIPGKKVEKTIDLSPYHRPHGILFMPDGEHVVVTAEAEQKLLVVNVATGTVTQAIDTDARVSHMVALTKTGDRAVVANIGSGNVSVIDLEKGTLVKVIQTGQGAEGIARHPAHDDLFWVTNRAAGTVSIFDASELAVTGTLESPGFPIRITFTPDGAYALVSNASAGLVTVYNGDTGDVVKTISMQATDQELSDDSMFSNFEGSPVPVGILVHPDGRYAYIANTRADMITVLDLQNLEVTGRLQAGKEPDGMAWSPVQPE